LNAPNLISPRKFVAPGKLSGGGGSMGGYQGVLFDRSRHPPNLSGVRVRSKLSGDNFPGGGGTTTPGSLRPKSGPKWAKKADYGGGALEGGSILSRKKVTKIFLVNFPHGPWSQKFD